LKDPVDELKYLKRQIVQATLATGEGHIPSSLSILDILYVLYDRVMRIDPKNPRSENRDRFILSKGHGSLALYSILSYKGFFPKDDLKRFAEYDSALGGHPDCNKVPGVEASTGSLGHGMPMGIGIALALRIKRLKANVFILVGDAECNEGSIWESALLAAHHRLTNITCIVDYNHSTDRALALGDLAAKFIAFGWDALVINGHDHNQIYNAVIQSRADRPYAIIAETIKGFGCKQMENNPAWHHRAPTAEEYAAILEELS
jgi:transketolase